ncbi:MAG: primase, partial [Acidimicrobiia bacterium]|nr:primase [Acidimicrobiia bacterium]
RGDELESPFRLDLDLRVAVMPDGLDPADLVQQDRSEELVSAVNGARPLLERRIEHEVSRHDLSGPEGRARALHAAAAQVRRINDGIARREYARYVARLVGVELEAAQAAIDGDRGRRGRAEPGVERPLDRIELELMRVLIADPLSVEGVVAEDFTDQRLRQAFSALDLSAAVPGEPVDISEAGEEETRSLLRSLAMDDRPLSSGPEILSRVKERRLDAEIEDLQRILAGMEPGTDAHSDNLRRLIALQQEKRSSTRM